MKASSAPNQKNLAGCNRIISYFSFVLLTCLLWGTSAYAQLSGTYTIGSGGNYSTIGAAVSDLTAMGVNGPVLFNVSAATFTEAVSIHSISGASSKNTITFQGAGRNKSIISYAGTVVSFNSSSWVGFSGFSISCSSSAYAIYSYYSSDCSVLNCDISTTNACCTYCIYDYYTNNWKVENCHISGGYYGIYGYSTPNSTAFANNKYINNRIVNFGYYATLIYYLNTPQYIGNVIDSSASGYGYGFYCQYESGAVYKNNRIIAPGLYYPCLQYYANYYSSKKQWQWINNICSGYQYYAYFYFNNSSNCLVAHNTFYGNSTNYAMYMYCYNAGSDIAVISNIFQASGAAYAAYIYSSGSTFPAPFSEIDGNTYLNGSGNLVYINNTGYATLSGLQSGLSAYTYTSAYNGQKSSFEQFASTMIPSYTSAPKDLSLNQSKPAPSGVYAGIDQDIDGYSRCKLFPTPGASESVYGKSKPTVIFYLPSKIYPGSPTYVYQSAKPGEPKMYHWYLNGVKVSDSVVLKTSAFAIGTNTLLLVTQTCGGNDSYQQTFSVSSPTAVPGTDFIADKNTILAGDIISFIDLSTNGPVKWKWEISPDYVLSNGVKVPSVKYITGSQGYQNPVMQFNFAGNYKICMTATNGVGNGATLCKTNYIHVLPTYNLRSGTQTVYDSSGYLFDNGGPKNNYTYDGSNGYTESMIIAPCADSVFLEFTQFDTYCGYDYVRLYEGKNNTGRTLWNSKCSATGFSSLGPGYVGGKAYTCSFTCIPNVIKPDTFKAKGAMCLQMVCYAAGNSSGIAAHWWSKPKATKKPVASFEPDTSSVCVNSFVNFKNTTPVDPNDPPTFLWDLDGSISTFECIGTCASASYPYFLTGYVKITLIATNCGGTDTFSENLMVYSPANPQVKNHFKADNLNPATNDIVFFTTDIPQCVEDYNWTIHKGKNNNGWQPRYVNGTSRFSANPQVIFSDTGYYTVTLYADNNSGAAHSTDSIVNYIRVRDPYCIPSVATLNTGLGISGVVFNTIHNKTVQASAEYSNFANDPALSTSIAIGCSYKITVSRDSLNIYDSMNRTVYIDWNRDGSFTGKNEIVANDSNSISASFSTMVKVPDTVPSGATIMRIAVNRGAYANLPCGLNRFGEYQDYRLYITPYLTLPVITLKGSQGFHDTISLEKGYKFNDPGYSAASYLYGNITSGVTITSKLILPNLYLFSYNVTDKSGNKAVTKYRLLKITPDKTPPDLIVDQPDTVRIEVTKAPLSTIPYPKVISSIDLVDGKVPVIISSGKVQTNIIGIYFVTYSASDYSGNMAFIYRTIKVIDTIAPQIQLIGKNPVLLEVFNAFTDPGVILSDNYNMPGELSASLNRSGNIDTSKTGTYQVIYAVKDKSGNSAVPVVRTVKVVDTIAPVIELNGPQFDSVDVFKNYTDKGVTVSDNYDLRKYINFSVSGSFFAAFPGGKNPDKTGTYTIIYTAVDKSGNTSFKTRIVAVRDHEPPVISLNGDAVVSVCRWFPYVDAGYTVSDNYDNINRIKVDTAGNFYKMGGTTMPNLLYITYKATDNAGNIAYSVSRYIEVKSEKDFTCVNAIQPEHTGGEYISVYPNPNNGKFKININITISGKTRITISNLLGQTVWPDDGTMPLNNNNTFYGNFSVEADLTGRPAGIYLLNIETQNQIFTRQIILSK